MKIITTSWDDGFKESLQIGELLKNYGLAGTFYVPVNAIKGEGVRGVKFQGSFLSKKELKKLSRDFEIGGHGISHQYLPSLPRKEARNEINGSKKFLEKITGKEIHGFAYPGGKYNQQVVEEVKKVGFTHARTVKEGSLNPTERFRLPVTVFCTSTGIGKLKFTLLSPFSKVYAFTGDWMKCIMKAYRNLKTHGGVLHVAGHPQDLSKPGFWGKIRKTLSKISGDRGIEYLTNCEVVERLMKEGKLI